MIGGASDLHSYVPMLIGIVLLVANYSAALAIDLVDAPGGRRGHEYCHYQVAQTRTGDDDANG